MEAAVFAHQPAQLAVVGDVFVEADQVVVIPFQIRHGLVGVIENRFAERVAVPFEAGDFAGFAADASGHVDELGDGVIAGGVEAWDGSGVAGDGFDLEGSVGHLGSLQVRMLTHGGSGAAEAGLQAEARATIAHLGFLQFY
jgi:hypothetical protein